MNKERAKIEGMFDSIAPKYDLLNHLLSAGVDRSWRRKLAKTLAAIHPAKLLDIATGTGDLALLLASKIDGVEVMGADISEGMLAVARQKCQSRGMSDRVTFAREDALALSLEEGSFDGVTVAFGVRNFENLEQGMSELLRVLSPGGMLCVLELSMPKNRVLRGFYRLYFANILPLIGRLTSKNPTAYRYLYESVEGFTKPTEFVELLGRCGYAEPKARPLTFGIATLYTARKSS